MRISYLSELVALAETRNFTEAAKRCHVSQSSFSKHISAIETDLGLDLIVRPSNPVKFTRAGSCLVHDSRTIVNEWKKACNRAKAISEEVEQEIRLGCFLPATRWILEDIHKWTQRNKSYARYSIKPISLSPLQLESALIEKRIDAAITIDPDGNLEKLCSSFPIKEERLMLAVSKKNALARRDIVSIEDLKDQAFFRPPLDLWPGITTHLDKVFASLPNYRNARVLEDVEMVLFGVECDMAVAMVLDHNRSNFGDRIRFIDVKEQIETDFSVWLKLYWLKENEESYAQYKHISYLKKIIRSIMQ